MRILLTNNTLSWRAGSELYLFDVARQLKRLGHEPVAYSPHLGQVAELLRHAGVPVVGNLAELPFRPDVIHGQHHVETMAALASLPGVPAVSFCHGAVPWQEMPPVFPRIRRYVAVDEVCRERIVREAAAPPERIRMLLNFVDTELFLPRPPLPTRPARALVLSNTATEANFGAAVRTACAQHGIAAEMRGVGCGNPAEAPQELLPQYDLVFAKARAAIEAMAVGCSVVLCDGDSLGPMVTAANFAGLRPYNFGFRTLRDPATVETITAAIRGYDPLEAAQVRDLVRTQADMRDAVNEIVRLYHETMAENAKLPVDPVAELRATGAYLQTLDTAIKKGLFGTAVIVPPATVPNAVALPPPARSTWLKRLLRVCSRPGGKAGSFTH